MDKDLLQKAKAPMIALIEKKNIVENKMKRAAALLLLLGFLLPLAALAQQESLTVYDGNGTDPCIPTCISVFDQFIRSQFVIPADDLTAMAGNTISSMKFYTTTAIIPYTTNCPVDVYLMEVDYTAIGAFEPKNNATVVYQGTLEIVETDNGGELTISFDEDFEYEGGNLLVGIENTEKGSSKEIFFYGTYVPYSAAFVGFLNYNTNITISFIPKTTFIYEPTICQKPATLTAGNITSRQATLTWSGGSGIYNLETKADGGTWTRVFDTTTTTSYQWENLSPDTDYQARVQSVCGDEVSGWKSVSFSTPIVCPAPTDLIDNVNFLTQTNILHWTENGEATTWQICLNEDENNLITTDSNPYDLTGLFHESLYSAKVRAYCNDIDQSRWSNTFYGYSYYRDPVTITADSPYFEGFESPEGCPWNEYWGGVRTPDGWDEFVPGSMNFDLSPHNSIWVEDAPNYVHSGAQSLVFPNQIADNYIFFPIFSNPINHLQISFWMQTADPFLGQGQLRLGYITSEDNGFCNTFTEIVSYDNSNENMVQRNTVLDNVPAEAIRLAFLWNGLPVGSSHHCFIDDVEVSINPALIPPRDIAAANITNHTADITWEGACDSYALRYREILGLEPILSEGFEGGEMPQGWNIEGDNLDPTKTWRVGVGDYQTNTGTHSGNYNALITHNTNNQMTYLVMPALDLSSYDGVELSFWYINRKWSSDIDEFAVCYRIGNEGGWNELWSTTENHEAWTSQSVELTGLANNYQIGFRFTDYYGYGVGLDDIVLSGVSISEWTTVGEAESPHTLTGLTIETTYEVQVKSNCEGYEDWSESIGFTTMGCEIPADMAVSDLTATSAALAWTGFSDSYNVRYRTAAHGGFSEDFESGTSFANWTFISMNTANAIGTSNGAGRLAEAAHSGSYGFRFSSYSRKSDGETYDQYLVSPELTVTGELSFYFKKTNASAEALYFGYSTTTNDLEAFTWTEDLAPTQSWQLYTQDLPADVKYVAFHYFGNYLYYVYVDDIVIGTEIPAGEWETVSTTEMNVTLTGLTPNTLYEAQVKGNCGEDDESEWSESAYFTTLDGCSAPVDLTCTEVTTTSANLSWTETSEGTAWQIMLNDDEENLIDADTNPYTLTGLNPGTEYTVKVRANCGSEQGAWSIGLTFATLCEAFDLPYYYGFEDAGDLDCWEVIATSSYTGITTANDAPEGLNVFQFDWSEHNAYLASPVFSGTEQGLVVTFQYMNAYTASPYIEQFQVGYTTDESAAPADFTYGDTIYGENHWVWYENTFPANTKRIAIKHIHTNGSYLRLDDFNFEPTPSCPRPRNLTAGTHGLHSVELGWTERGEATAWQICVNDDEENLIDADTNPYMLTGLTPETEYTVKVRANCGSEQSAWSNGLTFTIPCGAFALPYSYGFEDAGDLDCWKVIATHPNTGIATVSDAPEGSKVFRFDRTEQNAYLASPVFSGTEQGLDVAFQYMNHSLPIPRPEQFQVGYTTDADAAPADFTYGDTIYGENHWVRYENTFPANTKRIAIKYIYTYGWFLRLDDFSFEAVPSCPRPADLTAGTPEPHSVELGWTETGEATAWQICVNDDEENLIDADTNLYTLTGLTPVTEYTVKVRANCGSEQSAWSNGLTFTTPCGAFVALPYSYGFEDAGNLDCWEVIATNPNTGIATADDAPEGSKVFRFDYRERNAYLASPVFSGTELGLDVTFQYMNYNTTTSYTEQFQVGYTTDAGAAPADFIYGDIIYGENHWAWYENTFPANTKRIAIKYIYTDGHYLRLDDFNFESASCPRPTNLTAGAHGLYSVELGWTEIGEATAWQICVNDDEENLIDADTNLYTLTGLTPRTEYTVKVRANCGSEQSAWSNGLTFTTPCEAFDLPYSYGFEDVGDLECWEVIATHPNTGIATVGDAPEGSKVFLFYYDEQNAYLASPVFSGTELGLDVTFQYMNSSTTTSYTEQFQVGYTTDADAASADFIYGDTIYGENLWVTYENSFPANTKRIAIKHIHTNGSYLRLDDFNFEIVSSCPRPRNLTAGIPEPHSVELGWTERGEATAWQICVNDDEENLIDADTNPYTLTGLTPRTEYTVKVRANCGSEQSAWSNGLTFTTPCGGFVDLPYSYGFEDAGDLDCWEVIATSPNTGIATVDDAPEGSKVFRFHYIEHNAYLVSLVFSGTEAGLSVSFQYMNSSTSNSKAEQFRVGYTTEADAAPADFIYGDTIYGETQWVTYENNFPANTKRIAIKYIYTGGTYLRLDDFNFESASCPRPTNLTAESITATTADLSWNGSPDAESFTVRYRTPAGMDALFTEDFEDETSFSNWTFISMNTANAIGTSNGAGRRAEAAHSGSYGFRFSSYSRKSDGETYDQYLVSPELTVTGELSFYFKKPYNSGEHLYLGYSTTTNDLEAFTWTEDLAPTQSWQQYTQDLPTDVKYIAFHYFGDYVHYVYVDDIVIGTEIPAGEWESVEGISGLGTTLSGLQPDTPYEWQVQGICEGEASSWSEIAYFTTDEGITLTKPITGYGTGAGGYYLIASPVMETVRPTAGNGFLTNEYDLYRFDQSQIHEEWQNWKVNNFNLVSGKGYLYASQENTTLVFGGTPYPATNPVEVPLDYDGTVPDFAGWNLVGNPFAETAFVDREFYVMNGEGSEIVTAEGNTVEGMEGIFVVADGENESVTFTLASQNANANNASLVVSLSQNRCSVIDRAIVRFDSYRTLPKFQINPSSTKVYIPQGGKDYAVVSVCRDGVHTVSTEMPINFKAAKNGTYTLTFDTKNVAFDYLHLIDNLTGADVDLVPLCKGGQGNSTTQPATYTFTAQTTDYASRFRLVFSVCEDASDAPFAYISNGNIVITADAPGASLQVIDVMGRIIRTVGLSQRDNRTTTVGMPAGVYVLRLIDGNSVRMQKLVIE